MTFTTNTNSPYAESAPVPSVELMDVLVNQALGSGNRTLRFINTHTYSTLVTLVRDEIRRKIETIRKRSASYPHSRPILDMVLDKVALFAGSKVEVYTYLKFKTLIYQLELAHKLDRIDWDDHDLVAFSPVDELLIYMNYNSKTYIRMLEQWIADRIDPEQEPMEQLQQIQYYRKAFAQLQRKPESALHDDYLHIHDIFTNWFMHETEYLENQLTLWMRTKEAQQADQASPNGEDASENETQQAPIEWTLSADQIALIIRAADDSRLILAKSMNAVFQRVVPHIRTPHTESLSPSATRSRSYNAEQPDKDAAIAALKKMIRCIEGY